MTNEQRILAIRHRLEAGLNPAHLQIVDESAAHRGHSGAQSGAGHFAVTITSAAFNDLTPVAQHRLIYNLVDDLMGSEIHALRINAKGILP